MFRFACLLGTQRILEGAFMSAFDDLSDNPKVRAWLADAPDDVLVKTGELLRRVSDMRENEIIYPAQDAVLRALELTGPDEVRVVILGQDPYHEPGQAMGLSFSVPVACKLPPSLRNIYKEMADDLGCAIASSGDLTSWAAQGVLLLNTTLTVREHAANSHARLGWDVLTDYLISTCFTLPQPVVFMGWGRKAINLIDQAALRAQAAGASNVAERKPRIYSTHPSPLSARRAQADLPSFFGSRPFSTANKLLESCGSEPIRWESVLDAS